MIEYTKDVVEALRAHHQEDFFAAARSQDRDGVFQIVNNTACPVADVNPETGVVKVLSKRGYPTVDVSTPEGMRKLLGLDIAWPVRND